MESPASNRLFEPTTDDKRFIADAMLGKLVKWLRVLGIDVVYDPRATDAQLVCQAAQEDRILLTRDRRLAARRGTHRRLLIDSDYYHEQVCQVVHRFGLEPEIRVFTRCLRCNTPLCTVSLTAVAAKVPPYVAATQTTFKHCATCDRVYWGGTHRENMLRQLRVMLGARCSSMPQPLQ
ncbi:MAG TPA: Mut7-C RNAse domain-containing protein [Alphaproteobacteria bacterium]|nr:Mut7-C RNAse domain-containing protein [Alphaproteobacteria bacterium]